MFFVVLLGGLLCVSLVELGEDLLGDTLQHFLREDAHQVPADVKRLLDGPRLIVT